MIASRTTGEPPSVTTSHAPCTVATAGIGMALGFDDHTARLLTPGSDGDRHRLAAA
jgi:hypothetical protein